MRIIIEHIEKGTLEYTHIQSVTITQAIIAVRFASGGVEVFPSTILSGFEAIPESEEDKKNISVVSEGSTYNHYTDCTFGNLDNNLANSGSAVSQSYLNTVPLFQVSNGSSYIETPKYDVIWSKESST